MSLCVCWCVCVDFLHIFFFPTCVNYSKVIVRVDVLMRPEAWALWGVSVECGEEGQLLPWDAEGAGLMLYGCVFKLQCILGPEKKKSKVTRRWVTHRTRPRCQHFFFFFFFLITCLSQACAACKRFLLGWKQLNSDLSRFAHRLNCSLLRLQKKRQLLLWCHWRQRYLPRAQPGVLPPPSEPLRAALLLPPSKHMHQGPTSLH